MISKKRVIVNILAPILGVTIFIAIWWISASVIGKTLILPTPWLTLKKMFLLFAKSSFYSAVGYTLLRTIISFIIAFLLACLCAFFSVKSEFFRNLFSPFLVILRVLPTISIILLVLIWFYSETAPYVITFLVVFPMLYTTILNAALNVDKELLEMGKAYHFSKKKVLFSVYVPQMLSPVLTGVSITLSFSVKLTIAAEVLSFTANSMGRYMQESSSYIDTPSLLAWTLVAILLGFLLEFIVWLIRKSVVRYCHGN